MLHLVPLITPPKVNWLCNPCVSLLSRAVIFERYLFSNLPTILALWCLIDWSLRESTPWQNYYCCYCSHCNCCCYCLCIVIIIEIIADLFEIVLGIVLVVVMAFL